MSPMAPLTSWRLHQEGKSFDQEGSGQLLGVLLLPSQGRGWFEDGHGGLQPFRKEGFLFYPGSWNYYVSLALPVPIGMASHLS